MALPYLQSYTDPKLAKAYRLYIDGLSQKKILGKVKGLAQRTLARYCKNDGWEMERRARAVKDEAPNVAAVAAEGEPLPPVAANPGAVVQAEPVPESPLAPPPPSPPALPVAPETRQVGMERMLTRQQRVAGLLADALRRDVEETFMAAEAAGAKVTRSQISQLTTLTNNLFALERKAWCVPDKIQTEDTTPRPEDPVRKMTDDELDRADRELAERIAAAEGRARPDQAGEAEAASVN